MKSLETRLSNLVQEPLFMQSARDALERLIQQFAQPLAFLRELVQNSLDAGTTTVEIQTGFDKASKCCYLTVSDNGDGMTEEIIDNRLTRLFSSTKEDDLTKIGKFGIGFVSIFAIKPELVVLETGNEGESWRVLFKPDRSFEKRRLRHRVEGTSVTLYLKRPLQELSDLSKRAKETVSYWCKFSATDIWVNQDQINREFGFPTALYQFRFKDGNTEGVLRPTQESAGFQGYYNRGLTLLEGRGSPIAHLAFRVRSPYLEHTLSRDNILRDENYEKVMARLRKAAFDEMPRDIFEQLSRASRAVLWEHAITVLESNPDSLSAVGSIKIFDGVEEQLSLKDLTQEVYYHEQKDALAQAVHESGETVIITEDRFCLPVLRHNGRSVSLLKDWFLHYRAARTTKAETRLMAALKQWAGHLNCFICEALSSPSTNARLARYLHPKKQVRYLREGGRRRGDQIGLLRTHPLIQSALRLLEIEPSLAVAILVRKIHLDLSLPSKPETKLLGRLLKQVQREAPSS